MTNAQIEKLKTLRIGHSPDPDDAFMFYALSQAKVFIENYEVQHVIEDIQSLNVRALKGELEMTAISAAVYPKVADKYWILSSGASVGRKYGPIVVAKNKLNPDQLKGKRIAIPGLQTTAYLLLRIFLGDFEPVVMDFTKIIPAVQDGKVDAGLVIHEGQLNFPQFGVQNCMDLGVLWDQKYGLPIPLGLDVIRRDLGLENAKIINKALYNSLIYAMKNEDEALDYALQYGRGIQKTTAGKFVKMYVNEDTLDLGTEGAKALENLFKEGAALGLFPPVNNLEILY